MCWKQAKWIWIDNEISPYNYFVYFRKNISIPENIKKSELRITADSRYVLYFNGEYIGQGPARSFPEHQQYDVYDLTDKVISEKNTIAVLVHHLGVGTFQYIPGRAGFICELEITDKLDNTQVIGTDNTWKTKPCLSFNRFVPRISVQQGFEEQFDANKEIENWKEIEYNDTHWQNSVIIGNPGMKPWTGFAERDIPFLSSDPIYPVNVINTEIVKTIPYRWTLKLGTVPPEPKDKDADKKTYIRYIYTYIHAHKPESVTLYQLPPNYCPDIKGYKVNNKIYENKYKTLLKTQEINLKSGWNLLLIKTITNSSIRDLDYGIAVDSNQKLLFSYTKEIKDNPSFATITKFCAEDDPEMKSIWENGPDKVITAEINPIIDNNLQLTDIFFQTMIDKPVKKHKPDIVNIDSICSSNITYTVINPIKEGDTRLLLDFGKEIVGYFEFEIETEEQNVIFDFNTFEAIEDGKIHWTFGYRGSLRYISKQGKQKYRTYIRRAFRYCYLVIRNNRQPVKIHFLRLLLNTYPVVQKGSFCCSDHILDKIWEVGAWTLRLCMEDTYVDCPAYEQTHWVGDARNEALVNFVSFGAYDLSRHCLEQVSHSLKYNIVPESHVPSIWRNVIPAWTFLWIMACYEYYLYTGDKKFVKDIYPALKTTMNNFSKMITERGLIKTDAWSLLDWAPLDTPTKGEVSHTSMFFIKCAYIVSELAKLIGKTDDIKGYLTTAKKMKISVNKYLWSEKDNAFIDSIHDDGSLSKVISQQTNTIAYLCDCIDNKREEIIKKIITEPGKKVVKTGSPFFLFFVLEALSKSGQMQYALNLIREKYGLMLDKGATTWWETFPGYETYWWTRSHCHAWSSGATYFLSTQILGIQPIEPGFRKVLIYPHPCDLKWAKGRFPTPYGQINIEWKLNNNIIEIDIVAPKECKCIIKSEQKYKPKIRLSYI